MNTLIEMFKQKVLTLAPSESEPELSDLGMVQLELIGIRNDLAVLQQSVDDLMKVLTVQPAPVAPESVNTLAENEMLEQVATEPTVNALKPRKRSTPARKRS